MMIPLDTRKRVSVPSDTVKRETMNKEQVIALMKKQQGDRSGRAYAAELGISSAYLADVLAGNRDPGPAILEKLGLTRKTVFERTA